MEPKVTFINYNGRQIKCLEGENLRKVLRRSKAPVYNGLAQYLNCKGLGTCGTCAMSVKGKVSPPTKVEKWRLGFPPHKRENQLRLACQVQVLGDIEAKKHKGFWGYIVKTDKDEVKR